MVNTSGSSSTRQDVPMQIDDTENHRQLRQVGLALTESGARELRDTLTILLDDPNERHEHVSSSDFQQELTVWLQRG